MRRLRVALAALLSVVLLAGCGGEEQSDVDRFVQGARDKLEEVRDRLPELEKKGRELKEKAEKEKDKLVKRFREILEDLKKTVPEAPPDSQPPSTDGREAPTEIDAFLTEVITDVDKYWTTTLTASDVPGPQVTYFWVPPGKQVATACGASADELAALYCPADDTIYIGQTFASNLYNGIAQGLPGEAAGFGKGVGDFGVAYIVAHEYAHNVQNELGFYQLDQGDGARPFELQADCMAGLWGNSVFKRGDIKEGDVDEALATALAVGDFEYGDAQHHGTPDERRDAWLTGYESGDPGACRKYLPGS